MYKLSGLVIDAVDDRDGAVLRDIFPTFDRVPQHIKEAQHPESMAAVPDDLFALVMHVGDDSQRKFACVDAGNTDLSIRYFLKTGHKLPVEAQRLAAQNLVKAASWYGLDVPEALQKVALSLGGLMTLGGAAQSTASAGSKIKQNLATANQAGGIVNPHILKPQ